MTATPQAARSGAAAASLWQRIRGGIFDVNARPLTDYIMVLSLVWLLTGIGLTMVASSSMTWSALESSSAWSAMAKQAIMAAAGGLLFWVALRTPLALTRRLAGAGLVLSAGLLLLVLSPLGTGLEEVGSQSWLVLGPIRFQPSELAKVAFAIWTASFLADVPGPHPADAQQMRERWRGLGIYVGVSVIFTGLIALQHDFGMAGTFLLVVVMGLFLVGISMTLFGGLAAVVLLGIGWIMASGSYRAHRITVYLSTLFGNFSDTKDTSYQVFQGMLSLSEGSFSGVGLGESRAKWYYLPEATNDFIFAVIGEELGLVGATFVIILFGLLGWYGIRTAKNCQQRYLTLMAALLTCNIVVQALYNIAYVVGAAPVTGIQLPLISSGGTSIVVTLGSLGLVANCARHEPGAISAMANYGRPAIDRWFFLPEPSMDDVRGPGGAAQTPRAGRKPAPARGRTSAGSRDAAAARRRGEGSAAYQPRTRARRPGAPSGAGASRADNAPTRTRTRGERDGSGGYAGSGSQARSGSRAQSPAQSPAQPQSRRRRSPHTFSESSDYRAVRPDNSRMGRKDF